MDSRAAWSGDRGADSREAVEAVAASVAVLAALTGTGADSAAPPSADPLPDADPLRRQADDALDGLAEVARLEARTAALKVKLAADYMHATSALAAPAASPRDRAAQATALVAEVACVLTVSERTAGALLSESLALTTALPLTLAALQEACRRSGTPSGPGAHGAPRPGPRTRTAPGPLPGLAPIHGRRLGRSRLARAPRRPLPGMPPAPMCLIDSLRMDLPLPDLITCAPRSPLRLCHE
ncbi:hypothetical protein SAMN04487916_104126 [Arthrobacter sp. ov407]|uniref:hypothetical protein n=1 Tax=Arthrobacter sp. ov407 TaxID=1761748 RepID=UPI00088D889C|nr:hypothetical protein [Arthrobacter sp. ov407]SDK92841.1 hypothetical protein SAMN04487916_104126 [Arthrobacter sp. ov407]